MVDFRAFRGLRPAAGRAAEVAAVPYDVVNTPEARALIEGNPHSLLRVTRPDAELPDDVPIHDDRVYARAAENFARLLSDGLLVEDDAPALYVYALTQGDHRQVGLMGLASAADYWADRIKKHEHTRQAKEEDRLRHIQTVRAHLGPVFTTYRATPEIDTKVAWQTEEAQPEVDFVAPDGVRHQIWPIRDKAQLSVLQALFAEKVPALYIADGHHRAAAAARVGRDAPAGSPAGHFLAVAFPHDQLRILPYNRVVRDLHGHTPTRLLDALRATFEVEPLAARAAPPAPHCFTMFLDERWFLLKPQFAHPPPAGDPVARLDVSLLQDRVLDPILGIADPRTDERIDFVGGIRGLEELERRVRADAKVAFAMYPTSLDELMEIADAGRVMPPKSTWFEPKLRSGLVISRF